MTSTLLLVRKTGRESEQNYRHFHTIAVQQHLPTTIHLQGEREGSGEKEKRTEREAHLKSPEAPVAGLVGGDDS